MSENTTFVRVTSEHISAGVRHDCGCCPVALAVRAALGDLPSRDVAVDTIEITAWPGSGETWIASTPPAARSFIEAFDGRQPVEPFEFTLTWRIDEDGGQP